MAIFHSASALAASQSKRFQAVERSIRVLHRSMAESMVEDARDLTSGTISSAQLAKMGHPFGRGRRGQFQRSNLRGRNRLVVHKPSQSGIAVPKLPINVQRAQNGLRSSVRIIPENHSVVQSFRVQFTAPEASYVLRPGGTRLMVDRGFWPAMRKRWAPKNRQLLRDMRSTSIQIMQAA